MTKEERIKITKQKILKDINNTIFKLVGNSPLLSSVISNDSAYDKAYHKITLEGCKSIETFMDGDKSFVHGDWRAWRNAVLMGIEISPEEFKKLPKEERRKFLPSIYDAN